MTHYLLEKNKTKKSERIEELKEKKELSSNHKRKSEKKKTCKSIYFNTYNLILCFMVLTQKTSILYS
jgi:hypothetical protein